MINDEARDEKFCAGHGDLPLAVILDAETTLALPANLTAWTGMDAAVHALEALLVPGIYHPLCDGAALQALVKIDRNLREAVRCAEEWAAAGMRMLPLEEGAKDPRYVHHLVVRQEMLVGSALAAVSFQ